MLPSAGSEVFFSSVASSRASVVVVKTMMLPSWSAWVFSLSPFSRGPCKDLASVLGLVGLLPVIFFHDVLRYTPISHGWCSGSGAPRSSPCRLSTGSLERSCFHRGAHWSSPCRFSATIGHGHAAVCLLELENGYRGTHVKTQQSLECTMTHEPTTAKKVKHARVPGWQNSNTFQE